MTRIARTQGDISKLNGAFQERQLKVSKVIFSIHVGLSYFYIHPDGGVPPFTCKLCEFLNLMSFLLKGIFYWEVVVK